MKRLAEARLGSHACRRQCIERAGAQDGYLDGFHGELVDMAGKSRLANAECHGLHTDRLPAPLFNTIIGT